MVENSVDVHGSTGLTKLDRLSAAQLYLQLRSQNCVADNSYNTIISISVAFMEIMWYFKNIAHRVIHIHTPPPSNIQNLPKT